MPALPFDPVQLAPAFPDVAWAVGIAFVLAFVTFRPPRLSSMPDASEFTVVDVSEDDDTDA